MSEGVPPELPGPSKSTNRPADTAFLLSLWPFIVGKRLASHELKEREMSDASGISSVFAGLLRLTSGACLRTQNNHFVAAH
jgi:hypothetical protein